MDNDNPLLQKAADLYRGLRFTMKYRGVDILPAAAGNDLARDLLESGQPFLFGRCGATEMRTVADWLQNGGHNFTDRTRADIRNLSGVFPTDDATLDKFCRLYVKTAQSAELLALWNVGAEREVIRGCDATRFTELRALEPYYHARPWSTALAGKRVLVVHPFRRTILAQYEKRTQLFPGKDVLPELASLTVIQAVQGLGGQDTGYASWFDALTEMERRMDAADYDVAIVGAGAYSLPLAAHARERVLADSENMSLDILQAMCREKGRANGARFYDALKKDDLSFICEVKKASPSKGVIARDFPYLDIARDYEAAGADCISCLTEPKWFLGSDDIFREIRAAVSTPMLRKDFTVSDYQLYQSRLMGADCVLLICALLDTKALAQYLAVCDELGLSALVETHDADEIRSAVAAGAKIIGVNNRNLKDFPSTFPTPRGCATASRRRRSTWPNPACRARRTSPHSARSAPTRY